MAHWVGSPGCCWIDSDRDSLLRRAASEAGRYAAWRISWQPGFSPPSGAGRVLEEARTAGGPVGASGSPMAIFAHDRAPVLSAVAGESFDVAVHAWTDIVRLIGGLNPAERSVPPSAGRRTIEQTLEHLGNCFWWYCSRIDEGLPEWPNAGLSFEARAGVFLWQARAWCLERAGTRGSGVTETVPTRYPTDDPAERWTLGKVVRRQAEHLWEHLATVERDVGTLRRSPQ